MTYVYEKKLGKFDSSTNFEGNKLVIEYVYSSVDECIKVVQMWRHGANEFGEIGVNDHQMTWMSPESRQSLLDELDKDMTDRMCRTAAHSTGTWN
tara:strand:+ start:327 stop:611 length:285 start_codon:yes stop_codon:yes gene_type:complete